MIVKSKLYHQMNWRVESPDHSNWDLFLSGIWYECIAQITLAGIWALLMLCAFQLPITYPPSPSCSPLLSLRVCFCLTEWFPSNWLVGIPLAPASVERATNNSRCVCCKRSCTIIYSPHTLTGTPYFFFHHKRNETIFFLLLTWNDHEGAMKETVDRKTERNLRGW